MLELLPFLFILGLAFGSFLNVVILRYNPGDFVFSLGSLRGRSKCSHCDVVLRWYELIPVISFLIQKGRCRSCGKKLSYQYPIVELLSGFIFAGVPWFLFDFLHISQLGVSIEPLLFYAFSFLWISVFLIFILIAWIDRRHYIIPNELNSLLVLFGCIIVYLKYRIAETALPFTDSFIGHYALVFSPTENILFSHIIGAFAASLFFAMLILLSRGKAMGWGDVKLAFAGGLLFGWPDIGLSLAIAFVIGGIFGAFFILARDKKMKDKLPFGPFLVVGMTLTFFCGFEIVRGYLGFIGV